MRRMFSLKQLEEIANGRVKALVEGGTLENAKPLYYHGIEFYHLTNEELDTVFNFSVLNNSESNITWSSFKSWLQNITPEHGTTLINANGFYNVDNKAIVNIYSLIYYKDEDKMYIIGNKADFSQIAVIKTLDSWDNIFNTGTFTDRHNKLN